MPNETNITNKTDNPLSPNIPAALDSDEAKALTANLYKQNIEISGKNKTLSLLSKLYEISILTLAPKDLALQISQTIQLNLNFELAGLLLYDEAKHTLAPLAFADSQRLHKVQTDFNVFFNDLTPPLARSAFLSQVVQKKTMGYTEKLDEVWDGLVPGAMLAQVGDEGHVRSSIVYPLIIQDRVIGLLFLGLNRLYDDLVEYEKESIKSSINVIAVALDKALLYEQLKFLNNQLRLLDKARAEFISIASHQLRTPPATIKWYVGAVMDGDFGPLTPDLKAALERVQTSNNGQISLIDDLLNASRIERGKMEFFFEMGNVEELTKAAYEQLVPQAEMHKLKLLYVPPEKPLPPVMLDKEKVRQVVNNFIDNAIKYTKQGMVTVHYDLTPTDVVVKVTDSGRGVAPEVAPKLFGKYSRGKDSATAASGLGLGLYVAKVIIETNNGKIWVESPGEGLGSTFAFSLPIHSTLKATAAVDLTQTQEEHK
jgi:signal transduction histidine kinase